MYSSATIFSEVIPSNKPASPSSPLTVKIIGEIYTSNTFGKTDITNFESTTESSTSITLSQNNSAFNNWLKSNVERAAKLSNSIPWTSLTVSPNASNALIKLWILARSFSQLIFSRKTNSSNTLPSKSKILNWRIAASTTNVLKSTPSTLTFTLSLKIIKSKTESIISCIAWYSFNLIWLLNNPISLRLLKTSKTIGKSWLQSLDSIFNSDNKFWNSLKLFNSNWWSTIWSKIGTITSMNNSPEVNLSIACLIILNDSGSSIKPTNVFKFNVLKSKFNPWIVS